VYNNANTSYPLTDGLGSVRGMVNAMSDVLSTTTYSPYGIPDSPIAGFAFTGEERGTNGLQYHRARYYNAGLGTWVSLDPFEGIHNRPMSLNGYAWVEGNTANRVDSSGMCWDHPMSTSAQTNQCLSAWNNYALSTNLNDPTIRELLNQEDVYWGGLSYGEFINLWNDNLRRPPASTTPNYAGDIVGGSATTAFGVSVSWPGPGPEDAAAGLILFGGLCIATLAVIASTVGIGTITLPQRSTYSFSVNFDWNAIERDAVVALGTLVAGTPKILYRGTALKRAYSRTGLEAGLLWLADNVVYATLYAHFDGQVERDTSAISIYGILQTTLTTLVASGNVQQRFQVEYGFDTIAQAALVGPVVIPIPDFFRG
jgi:RHS repeat-associated protein